MARSPKALVDAAVLQWLRNASGYSVEEAARRTRAKPQNLQAWAEWKPVAHVRKLADIQSELEKPSIRKTLLEGVTSVEQAFEIALKFAVNLDPISITAQKEKEETRKKTMDAAKAKRDAEAKAKKEKEAADKAASII